MANFSALLVKCVGKTAICHLHNTIIHNNYMAISLIDFTELYCLCGAGYKMACHKDFLKGNVARTPIPGECILHRWVVVGRILTLKS